MRCASVFSFGVTLLLALRAAQAQEPPPGVDDYKVQQALKKASEWLKSQESPAHAHGKDKDFFANSDELVLLALLHARCSADDPFFKKLLDRSLKAPLERTYKVALWAMFLEDLDRAKHQLKIWECAQYLLDNQCVNGQWSYGAPTTYADKPEPVNDVATTGNVPAESVRVFGDVWPRPKPKVTRKLMVKPQKNGPATGDNSNTQYGALGLRACFDAGIRVMEEPVARALLWWRNSQFPPDPKDGVYGGRGWNYKDKETQDKPPYLAMSAGGVASLVIYEHMLGREWKRSSSVAAGMKWMEQHYKVNTGYYYMYGLERLGMIYGTEKIGDHFWYVEGAQVLLKAQKPDGSWGSNKDANAYRNVHDTCFAILFLSRATRPLVESVDK